MYEALRLREGKGAVESHPASPELAGTGAQSWNNRLATSPSSTEYPKVREGSHYAETGHLQSAG